MLFMIQYFLFFALFAVVTATAVDRTCDPAAGIDCTDKESVSSIIIKLPKKVEAILREDWDYLDPQGQKMVADIRSR